MSKDSIHTFLSLVDIAADSAIMMSRMHCHADHVSSIVLRNTNGQLMRAFLAWPGHRLHTNTLHDELAVGVHDHRYSLSLSLIHGDVVNVNYERHDDPSQNLLEWEFRSGVVSGNPRRRLVGDGRSLAEVSRSPVEDGVWMSLDKDTLHNVEARGICGWLVEEWKAEKDTTTLFTKRPFSTDGLYQPFGSRQEIESHVAQWVREVA